MRSATGCGTALVVFALLLPAVPGGGKAASTQEEVVKEMLATLEQVLKVLGTIQDQPSAAAARPELKKSADRLADLRKQAREIRQPTREEKDRIEKQYQGKFDAVLQKLRTESIRVKGIPGGAEAIKELAVAPEKKQKNPEKTPEKK